MLNVVVKGNALMAIVAARARGIMYESVGGCRPNAAFQETTLLVGDEYESEVVRWFSERQPFKMREGYPDGTCLLYSQTSEAVAA